MGQAPKSKEIQSLDRVQSEYARRRDQFSSLNRKTRELVEELTTAQNVLSVTGRVKDVESYAAKALRTNPDGSRRYIDPITEITDISGIRVICFTLAQVHDVCNIITTNFDIIEFVDKTAEIKAQRRLGYTSFHYIVKLQSNRLCLPEYSGFQDLQTEIQVRTILQHAWAEIEHRVQYKRAEIDDNLFNKFLALAGLISIADREFEEIIDLSNELNADFTTEIAAEEADEELAPEVSTATAGSVAKGRTRAQDINLRLHDIKNMFGIPPRELIRNRQFDKAEVVYTAFIEEQPTQPSHFRGRALARMSLGKIVEARADLIEANRLAPNNITVEQTIKRLDDVIARN